MDVVVEGVNALVSDTHVVLVFTNQDGRPIGREIQMRIPSGGDGPTSIRVVPNFSQRIYAGLDVTLHSSSPVSLRGFEPFELISGSVLNRDVLSRETQAPSDELHEGGKCQGCLDLDASVASDVIGK